MGNSSDRLNDLARLHSLRRRAEALVEASPESLKNKHTLTVILLLLCKTESIVLRLGRSEEASDLITETRQVAHKNQLFLQVLYVKTHNVLFPNTNLTLQDLHIPGSDGWVRMYTMVTLTMESTYKIHQPGASLSRDTQALLTGSGEAEIHEISSTEPASKIQQPEVGPSGDVCGTPSGLSAGSAQTEDIKFKDVSNELSTSKRETCPVCLEEYLKGQWIVQLPCNPGHRLHYWCLSGMAAQKHINFVCPLCRGNLLAKD